MGPEACGVRDVVKVRAVERYGCAERYECECASLVALSGG